MLSTNTSKNAALVIVLAGLQDPGNLGTILRSAEAFGATGVVSLPGTVSAWNPKAVRASAGSVFRVPLLAASEEECFAQLREAGVKIFATTTSRRAKPADLRGPGRPGRLSSSATRATVFPEDLVAKADANITIPCPGPVESLNAAVAASVLLYEASRQRFEQACRQPATLLQDQIAERGATMSLFDRRAGTLRRTPPKVCSMQWRGGAPLAERMRPRSLDELLGQEHLVGPGKPSARADRARRRQLDDLLGSARRGQNHAGQDHCRDHQGQLHRVLRRHQRHQGDQAGDGHGGQGRPASLAHHSLRRRDSPLQQGAAGRVSALRGARHHPADRRDHRESVV